MCGHSWFRHIPGNEADGCAEASCPCENFEEK